MISPIRFTKASRGNEGYDSRRSLAQAHRMPLTLTASSLGDSHAEYRSRIGWALLASGTDECIAAQGILVVGSIRARLVHVGRV